MVPRRSTLRISRSPSVTEALLPTNGAIASAPARPACSALTSARVTAGRPRYFHQVLPPPLQFHLETKSVFGPSEESCRANEASNPATKE